MTFVPVFASYTLGVFVVAVIAKYCLSFEGRLRIGKLEVRGKQRLVCKKYSYPEFYCIR